MMMIGVMVVAMQVMAIATKHLIKLHHGMAKQILIMLSMKMLSEKKINLMCMVE